MFQVQSGRFNAAWGREEMTAETRTSQAHPRLVGAGDHGSQAGSVRALSAALGHAVWNDRSRAACPGPQSAEPISLHVLGAEEAQMMPNDCLEALELISSAAHAMATIEDQSQRVQSKAFALIQRIRSERIESNQQIANLQEQLAGSRMISEQLKQQLTQAEERANVAEEWLRRLHDAIVTTFSALKAGDRPDLTTRPQLRSVA